MTTITSSILALLAAAPESPEPETSPTSASRSSNSEEPAENDDPLPSKILAPEPPVAVEDEAAPEREPAPDEYRGGLVIDQFGPVETIDVEDIAGSSIPTSSPRAFPRGPRKGLLGDVFRRSGRLTARGGGPSVGGKWEFTYHGFLRSPFRLGINERRAPSSESQQAEFGPRTAGQSRSTLHDPVIPDDQYLSYAYTRHSPRDWAELYLNYGNGIVAGTVSLQGFNFSDTSWVEPIAQFGVAQAYVTLTPKLRTQRLNLMWKVGSFYNRYGMSGRYDQGEIETYLFSRTHTMGETLTANVTLNPDFNLWIEHGIGATRPDPQQYNAARFTLLHHVHLGFRYQKKLEFNVHWLHAFSREANRIEPAMYQVEWQDAPNGDVHIVGPELRIDWGRLGFIYAGFSYIHAKGLVGVSRAFEVIHAMGGGQFRHGLQYIYFAGAEQGEIFSVIAQLENSIQKIRLGSNWWGQGPDLVGKFYFMVNKVRTDFPDDMIGRPMSEDQGIPLGGADGDLKYKIGFDLLGRPLAWFGVGVRITHISPDSDHAEQRFTIISPRLQFRTHFLSQEIIELQYSRYVYNERICPPVPPDLSQSAMFEAQRVTRSQCVQPPRNPAAPSGFGSSENTNEPDVRGSPYRRGPDPGGPDEDVIMLVLTMWW